MRSSQSINASNKRSFSCQTKRSLLSVRTKTKSYKKIFTAFRGDSDRRQTKLKNRLVGYNFRKLSCRRFKFPLSLMRLRFSSVVKQSNKKSKLACFNFKTSFDLQQIRCESEQSIKVSTVCGSGRFKLALGNNPTVNILLTII